MNFTRMKEMADFFENLPPERFYIGAWTSYFDPDSSEFFYDDHITLDINDCDTAGCVAGWTCAIYNDGIADYYDLYDRFIGDDGYDTNEVFSWEAAKILDLTIEQAELLFYVNEKSLWYKYREDYDILVSKPASNVDYPHRFFILPQSVHPKHVADMLNRIVRGEIKEML